MRHAGTRSSDPVTRARELAELHSAQLSGQDVSGRLRSVILESWQRSLRARVDPDRPRPRGQLAGDELDDRRQAHPFTPMLPMLRETLLGAADEALHIMIITDEVGNILWREGSSPVKRNADSVALAEGTRWSEDSIGTNAMGTALATGAPVQIHSAEHLVRTYHQWTCAASPVHDPDTGALLGTLDISGPLSTMHPALLSLACTSARLVESQLRLSMQARDDQLRQQHAARLARLGEQRGALLSDSGRVVSCTPRAWLAVGQRIALDGPVVLDGGEDAEVEPLPGGGYLLRARPGGSSPRPVPLPEQTLPEGSLRESSRLESSPPENTVLSGSAVAENAAPEQSASGEPTPAAGTEHGSTVDSSAAASSVLALSLLGDKVPTATVHGTKLDLTLRHAEVLALLAMHPGGLTAEQLALLLHGEQGNPTSTRVEIHRLRNHVGHDVLRTKPYRITAEVRSDFAAVRDALRNHDLDSAAAHYRGPLLPRSESPKVREEREELLASYRSGLLGSGRVEPLWQFAQTESGHDDIEVLDELRMLLPENDPRAAAVRNRVERLLKE